MDITSYDVSFVDITSYDVIFRILHHMTSFFCGYYVHHMVLFYIDITSYDVICMLDLWIYFVGDSIFWGHFIHCIIPRNFNEYMYKYTSHMSFPRILRHISIYLTIHFAYWPLLSRTWKVKGKDNRFQPLLEPLLCHIGSITCRLNLKCLAPIFWAFCFFFWA